jgi:uncharacterized protein YbjQ (UPF0145 family)
MRNGARFLLAALFLVLSQTSAARDTFHDLSVEAALKGPDAGLLRDVPVFMQGQDHPAVAQDLGTFTSNRNTNAFNKSDEDACARAFMSAIIALQDRAKSLGGTAVIDIKSITKHNDLVSATQYRCDAGSINANVALTGTVVKLK